MLSASSVFLAHNLGCEECFELTYQQVSRLRIEFNERKDGLLRPSIRHVVHQTPDLMTVGELASTMNFIGNGTCSFDFGICVLLKVEVNHRSAM